jgi:hypothetical protein
VIAWRIPVVVVLCASLIGAVGFFVLPRPHPAYRDSGVQITVPDRRPAADASGRAGWVWPDGVPGWTPGQTIHGYPVSGLQAVEVQAAQLAAARNGLDAQQVHVLDAMRGGKDGVLAILAAPTMFSTPKTTCLAAVLPRDAPVDWLCPGPEELAGSHVLVAATRYPWAGDVHPIYLVGVARGDVDRVVLVGGVTPRQVLYVRGKTWGQFDSVQQTRASVRLLVYGHHRLLETVSLRVPVGAQRVIR